MQDMLNFHFLSEPKFLWSVIAVLTVAMLYYRFCAKEYLAQADSLRRENDENFKRYLNSSPR